MSLGCWRGPRLDEWYQALESHTAGGFDKQDCIRRQPRRELRPERFGRISDNDAAIEIPELLERTRELAHGRHDSR
jgi:hypothetical protein